MDKTDPTRPAPKIVTFLIEFKSCLFWIAKIQILSVNINPGPGLFQAKYAL